jgi:hypothetical protein
MVDAFQADVMSVSSPEANGGYEGNGLILSVETPTVAKSARVKNERMAGKSKDDSVSESSASTIEERPNQSKDDSVSESSASTIEERPDPDRKEARPIEEGLASPRRGKLSFEDAAQKARSKKEKQKAKKKKIFSGKGTEELPSTEEGPDSAAEDHLSNEEDSAQERAEKIHDETKPWSRRCGPKAESRKVEKAKDKQINEPRRIKRSHFIDGLEPEKAAQVWARSSNKKVIASYREQGQKRQDRKINGCRKDKEHEQQFGA